MYLIISKTGVLSLGQLYSTVTAKAGGSLEVSVGLLPQAKWQGRSLPGRVHPEGQMPSTL